jgi:hypothetical protein
MRRSGPILLAMFLAIEIIQGDKERAGPTVSESLAKADEKSASCWSAICSRR